MTRFLKAICGSRYSSLAIFISLNIGLTLGLPSHLIQLFTLLAFCGLVFFNLSLRLTAITAVVAWLMGFVFLDPILQRIGERILELMPDFLGFLSNLPLIAWFRFNNTMVIGPITVIFLLSPFTFVVSKIFKQMIGETAKGDFGILRLKVFIPFLAGVIGILIYVALFLDLHLRWSLKKGLEFASGTEVNIGKLETSFKEASLKIQDIQMTDAEFPMKNALSVQNLKFDLSFRDILRGKVVIEDSTLEGLAFGSNRKKAGWVKPKPIPTPEDTIANPEVERIKSQGLDALRKLQDVAIGLDPTAELRKMNPEDFPSAKQLEKLRMQISSNKDEWQKNIDSLPKSDDFKSRLTQIKSIKAPSDLEDVARFQGQIDKIKAESQQDIEKMTGAYEQISQEINGFSNSLNQLGDLAKADMDFVLSALKLPQIDSKALAKDLLEPIIGRYVSKALKYYGMVEPYLKSEKKKSSKALRLSGIIKSFPSRDSAPPFWWKKAFISWYQPDLSKTSQPFNSSDGLKGELFNFCSAQDICDKPFQLKAAGNLTSSDIKDIIFNFEADHRGSTARDNLSASIGAFSISGITLSDAEDLKIAIGPSKSHLELNLINEQESLSMQVQVDLNEFKWDFSAKNAIAQKILTAAFMRLSSIKVTAIARGTDISDLDWELGSNVSQEIEASFKAILDKELGAVRGQLENEIKGRIFNERKKLEAEFNKVKTELMAKINTKKAEIKAVLDDFERLKLEGQGKAEAIINEANMKVAAEKARIEAEKDKKIEDAKSKAKDALKSKLPLK